MKINNLTPHVGALDGSEPIPTVKGGTKRITSAQIAALGQEVGVEGAAVLAAVWSGLQNPEGATKVGLEDGGVLQDHVNIADQFIKHQIEAKPFLYFEHGYKGLFGRGMLTSELNNIITEQFVSNAPLAAGSDIIICNDLSKFSAGGTVALDYSDGTVGIHFIEMIGSGLAINPPLPKPIAIGGKVERVWWNKAHTGKRYNRWMAQTLAAASELDLMGPVGPRNLFCDMRSDDVVPVGNAVVTWVNRSNLGHNDALENPVNRPSRCAQVDNVSNGEGAETRFFQISYAGRQMCRVRLFCLSAAVQYEVRVVDDRNKILARYDIPQLASRSTRDYRFQFNSRGASKIKIQVVAKSGAIAGSVYFIWSKAEVFPVWASADAAIPRGKGPIVVIGDSNVAGDTITTPERVGLAQSLQDAMPEEEIINEGVGGNSLPDVLARWHTSVTVHNPACVILYVGTNDSSSPSSVTFDPNARENMRGYWREVINKCDAARIRLIVVGPPSLSQADPDFPLLPEWELNNRSSAYADDFEADAGQAPQPANDAAIFPLHIHVGFNESPGASQILLRWPFAARTVIPADFAQSRGVVGVGPAATWTIDVLKNGASFGEIEVSPAGVVSFSTGGLETEFLAGDRIDFLAPNPADVAIANCGFTIRALTE